MKVEQRRDGTFAVIAVDGRELKSNLSSNAQAWRWIDQNDEEAVEDDNRRRRISVAFQSR